MLSRTNINLFFRLCIFSVCLPELSWLSYEAVRCFRQRTQGVNRKKFGYLKNYYFTKTLFYLSLKNDFKIFYIIHPLITVSQKSDLRKKTTVFQCMNKAS